MGIAWGDELLTVQQVAEYLQLNQQTVRNLIDAGSLPALRIGRRVRVRRLDLDELMASHYTGERPSEAPAPSQPVAPSAQTLESLRVAHDRARRLLGRVSGVRRADLAAELQHLADVVEQSLSSLTTGSELGDGDASRDPDR